MRERPGNGVALAAIRWPGRARTCGPPYCPGVAPTTRRRGRCAVPPAFAVNSVLLAGPPPGAWRTAAPAAAETERGDDHMPLDDDFRQAVNANYAALDRLAQGDSGPI